MIRKRICCPSICSGRHSCRESPEVVSENRECASGPPTVSPKLQKRWILKDNFCEHGFHISKYNVSSWSCLNRFLNLRRNFENLTFELFSSLHLPVKSWFLLFFENHEVWRDIKHLQLDLVGSSKHQWLPEHLLALLDKNQKNHFTTT